jgi:hypothetical protein
MPAHECQIFPVSCQVSLYADLKCYSQTAISQSKCQVLYFICYMPNAVCSISSFICQMLCAICGTPYARLQYAKCCDHCYVFQYDYRTGWTSHYKDIYYPAMTLHIAVTEKKLLLYHHGFRSQVFQFVSTSGYLVISWVTYISVCRHIMAWAKFQYADISWHRPKSPITVYFGSPAYQGIYQ